jgi:hypothetical protein
MDFEQIDTSTTAGKAEVMRLAAEGRRVVRKSILPGSVWEKWPHPEWNWGAGDYAIIAEPVGPEEIFVAVGPGPALEGVRWYPSDAARLLPGGKGEVVKYVRADLVGKVP